MPAALLLELERLAEVARLGAATSGGMIHGRAILLIVTNTDGREAPIAQPARARAQCQSLGVVAPAAAWRRRPRAGKMEKPGKAKAYSCRVRMRHAGCRIQRLASASSGSLPAFRVSRSR